MSRTQLERWDRDSPEFQQHLDNMRRTGAPGGYYIIVVESKGADRNDAIRKVGTYREGPFLYRRQAKSERDTLMIPHDDKRIPPPRGYIVGFQRERMSDRRRMGTPRLLTPVEKVALRIARGTLAQLRRCPRQKYLPGLPAAAVVACLVSIARRYNTHEEPELLPWLMDREGHLGGLRMRLREWLAEQSGKVDSDGYDDLIRRITYEAEAQLSNSSEMVFDLVEALAGQGALG